MSNLVWHTQLRPALVEAVLEPLRARGVELWATPPVDRAPDGILAHSDARPGTQERLASAPWAASPPPAQIILVDLARYESVCDEQRRQHQDSEIWVRAGRKVK